MIKRLYLVLAFLWALMMFGNALTKDGGPGGLDYAIAFAPFALGFLLSWCARFIVTGNVTKPRVTVYRNPRP